MRFLLLAIALLIAACSSGGDPVVTSTTIGAVTTSTSISTSTSTIATATTTTEPTTTTALRPTLNGLTYTEIAAGLPFPVLFTFRPADGQNFIPTKNGQVWVLTENGAEEFLDISDRVTNSGERGLLGMAWHPTDPDRLFLHYSDLNGDTTISEFIDGEERFILRVTQPAANHNGGMIEFGPDGYLYIALGDGGGGGDQFGNGQPVDDLLASLLRIDVDSGDPYGIPDGNPYADGSGAPEVWASGLRNPWRFSFDNGLIYIGDVGQGAYEEISVAPADAAGINYGWPITEGLHCFDPREGCDVSGQTLPVLEVAHSDAGTCAIVGGVVYRGEAIPELEGHYFYSDSCAGYLRSFVYSIGVATERQDWSEQVGSIGGVISFGRSAAGEVYVMNTETVYRIDPVR
jgi:glucose/arabinose dehydrogenase